MLTPIKRGDIAKEVYYQTPKWLLDMRKEKKVTAGAVFMYIYMFDRMRVSEKNKWHDDNDDIFIKYSYDEFVEDLGCSRLMVSSYIKELLELGLIQKKRAFNSSNRFYLSTYQSSKKPYYAHSSEKPYYQSSEKPYYQSSEKSDYCASEKSDTSKNNLIKNNISKNNINVKQPQKNDDITIPDSKFKSLEFKEALDGFIEHRNVLSKKKKTSFTNRALKLLIDSLEREVKSEQEAIELLNEAVVNGWISVVLPSKRFANYKKPQKEGNFIDNLNAAANGFIALEAQKELERQGL